MKVVWLYIPQHDGKQEKKTKKKILKGEEEEEENNSTAVSLTDIFFKAGELLITSRKHAYIILTPLNPTFI